MYAFTRILKVYFEMFKLHAYACVHYTCAQICTYKHSTYISIIHTYIYTFGTPNKLCVCVCVCMPLSRRRNISTFRHGWRGEGLLALLRIYTFLYLHLVFSHSFVTLDLKIFTFLTVRNLQERDVIFFKDEKETVKKSFECQYQWRYLAKSIYVCVSTKIPHDFLKF